MQPAIRPAATNLRCAGASDPLDLTPPHLVYRVFEPLESCGLQPVDLDVYLPATAHLALVRNLLRTVPHAVRWGRAQEAR